VLSLLPPFGFVLINTSLTTGSLTIFFLLTPPDIEAAEFLLLIHLYHLIIALSQNTRKISDDLRVSNEHLEYLPRLHGPEQTLCFENAPGAAPTTSIQDFVCFGFFLHEVLRSRIELNETPFYLAQDRCQLFLVRDS